MKIIEQAEEEIIEDWCFELSMVGGGFDNIKLAIWGSDGTIPHFHFYKGVAPNEYIPDDGRGGGCICFLEPCYFKHDSHEDALDRKQIEDMINFLRSNIDDDTRMTVWKYMITLWNENNPESPQVPYGTKIPAYYSQMSAKSEE